MGKFTLWLYGCMLELICHQSRLYVKKCVCVGGGGSQSGKKTRDGAQHERQGVMVDVSDTHFHMGCGACLKDRL